MANTEIRLIIFFALKDGEALYCQQKQDWELIMDQIMNSLLPNSDLYRRKWGKPLNHSVSYYCDTEVYAPTSNAKEAEVERFYEDLQDLLELTPKKDVLFIIGDWNAKVGSQEIPGVTGKFGLGVQNEPGERLIEFCQENTLVIANTLFQQHKRRLLRILGLQGD